MATRDGFRLMLSEVQPRTNGLAGRRPFAVRQSRGSVALLRRLRLFGRYGLGVLERSGHPSTQHFGLVAPLAGEEDVVAHGAPGHRLERPASLRGDVLAVRLPAPHED